MSTTYYRTIFQTMSSKKIKKREKKFYCYPEQLNRLSDLSKNLGHPETELIEASINFFLDCPPEFQERIFGYYYYSIARMYDPDIAGTHEENIRKLVRSAPPLGASKSTKPKPE